MDVPRNSFPKAHHRRPIGGERGSPIEVGTFLSDCSVYRKHHGASGNSILTEKVAASSPNNLSPRGIELETSLVGRTR